MVRPRTSFYLGLRNRARLLAMVAMTALVQSSCQEPQTQFCEVIHEDEESNKEDSLEEPDDKESPEISNELPQESPKPDEVGKANEAPFPESQDPSPNFSFPEARSKLKRIRDPKLSASDREQLRLGNLELSFELLRRLDPEGQSNLALSALSIRLAMGMVHAMAMDQTQQEITKAMHFLADAPSTHAGLNYFEQALRGRRLAASKHEPALELRSANRLFFRSDKSPSSALLDILAQNFGTGISLVDFAEKSESARKEINAWVAQQTQDRIPELFSNESLNQDTDWVFANALYVRAPWGTFVWDASDEPFFTQKGEQVRVPFLGGEHTGNYGQGKDLRWASLPLRGDKLELLILLPNKGRFDAVRQSLNAAKMQVLLQSAKKGPVRVRLPEFKIQGPAISLSAPLQDMGLRALFGDSANLKAAVEPGTQAPSKLRHLVHQVYLAVSEEGVEAAGATGGEGAPKGGSEEPPMELKADRPFFFAIHDRPTGLFLFAGQVTDPRSKN